MSTLDVNNYLERLDIADLEVLKPAVRTPADRAVVRQLRAARGLLGWSQEALAGVAGVTSKTISNFERGVCVPCLSTENAIRESLEKFGIVFIQGDDEMGPGVQLAENLDVSKFS